MFASLRSLIRSGLWLAVLLGVVLELAAANPPGRWRWSNPLPHGASVFDMAYSPSQFLAVQVAERGQIYTSDDFSLWLPRESGTTDSLRAVTFFGSRIVITGERGRVLYADSVENFQSGTLADGATEDWLEAVASSPLLVVAVGDFGAVYTSQDGRTWARQASGTEEWLRGVAYGGGTFVAVGRVGTILVSADGTNWSGRSCGRTNHLNRVRHAAGQFTAVGDQGTLVCSTNQGATWYPESTGATNGLENTSAGGGDQLAVGDGEVRLKDGGAWTNELAKSNGPPAWTYYSCVGQSGFYVIAGQSGVQSEGYQTNGAPYFWLTPYDSVRNWLWDVTYAGFLYVTVGDYGTVMTSGNGVNWTLEVVPLSATGTTFLGVGGTTNLLVAVGDSGTIIVSPNQLTNVVFTNELGTVITQTVSSLGVNWYAIQPPPTEHDLQAVTALSNRWYFVAGGNGTVLASPNGLNWAARSTPTTRFLSSLAAWSGGLVATGDGGTILTSADGQLWVPQSSGTLNWLYRVRYLNGLLITVGQNGTLLTSSNGVNWTAHHTGTTKWLNDITHVDGTYYVVGSLGTVLTSTNLADWDSPGTLTKHKSLYGAATDGRQLVTVGTEGFILRSPIVPDLTPIEILAYARMNGTNGTPTQNLFLFGGHPDQQFTLDRASSVAPTNWSASARLEIFDPSGVLYYLETITGTNQPAREFYRATLQVP